MEIIGYQNGADMGPKALFIRILFIGEGLLGWKRADRPTTKCSITNLLRIQKFYCRHYGHGSVYRSMLDFRTGNFD